jgi:hypothetical protein
MNQNEARDLGNLPRGLERREEWRRRRSGGGVPAAGGAPAAVWFGRGRRRGEGCGVMRERCPAFIGQKRGRGGGVEAVARAQWPAAIDGDGARVGRPFREGRRRGSAW